MLYIFDWDGTLCNSIDKITSSIENSCRQLGLPVRSYEENKSIIGLGLLEALEVLYPELSKAEILDLREAYRVNYLSADKSAPSPLFEGTMDVLEALKSCGHQLAVATGKSRAGLDRVLSGLDMLDYFDSSRCCDETRSKPHPLMLEQILEELSVSPQDAVMVGDTDFDLLMAKAANVEAVGVSYGAHPLERLQKAEPARIIDRLSELL